MHLKSLFLEYKSFFIFLLKFLLSYIFFTIVYKQYLNQYDPVFNEIDAISQTVANQTNFVLQFFGYETRITPHDSQPAIKVFFKDRYVSRIVEGCNAISVIILFAAFIFAFSNTIKRTFMYILVGAILIYVLNILRIALLTYALYYYPEYDEILHGTVFPLFIYGVVFLLWILWIIKFYGYERNFRK